MAIMPAMEKKSIILTAINWCVSIITPPYSILVTTRLGRSILVLNTLPVITDN